MGAKKWTEEEDHILRENWANNRDSVDNWVRLIPGRTSAGATKRAETLGLGSRMDERTWSKEEDDRLREVWKAPGPLKWKVNQFPGRTWFALCNRGAVLGLQRRTSMRVIGVNAGWVEGQIVKVLTDSDPLTVKEIARLAGVSSSRVGHLLDAAHGEKYRIADWTRNRFNGCGDWWPKWGLGAEPDAPKPPKQTKAERNASARAKRRIKAAQRNPFLVAAGLIQAPKNGKGRVYAQPMDVQDWPQSRKAA